MLTSLRRGLLVAAATAAAVGGLALSASATTVACQNEFGDQCSTFGGTSLQPHDVFWDVKGTTAKANVPVIGYGVDSPADKATDFVKVLHIGVIPGVSASVGTSKSYSFVYAPNGHWSNLCVADTGTHLLSLRTCNGGQFQRFVAERTSATASPTPVGSSGFQGDRIRDDGNTGPFALMNAAYHLYVADTSHASSFGPAATPDTRQLATVAVVMLTANDLWAWQS